MAVENAACPFCGREVLVTVPSGQYLVQINRYQHSKTYSTTNLQSCFCSKCKRHFYAETAFPRKD